MHKLLVNRLFKPAKEKVWLGELTGQSRNDLGNTMSVKYYLLRAFPKKMKQLSSILTNIYGG